MTRVFIADDHAVFVDCFELAMASLDVEVVGSAPNGIEALAKIKELHPQIVLLDVNMPQMNGIDVARQVLRFEPHAKVIVLTFRTDEELVAEALRAGVHGFIHKSDSLEQIHNAIRRVIAGDLYISNKLLGPLLQTYVATGGPIADPLSSRERQVLQLVAEGHTTKEIGSILDISPKTAESHRARMMDKLHIHDTASLVRYAVRRGIVGN